MLQTRNYTNVRRIFWNIRRHGSSCTPIFRPNRYLASFVAKYSRLRICRAVVFWSIRGTSCCQLPRSFRRWRWRCATVAWTMFWTSCRIVGAVECGFSWDAVFGRQLGILASLKVICGELLMAMRWHQSVPSIALLSHATASFGFFWILAKTRSSRGVETGGRPERWRSWIDFVSSKRLTKRWTHETDLLSSSAILGIEWPCSCRMIARIRSIFEIFARGAIVAIRFVYY
jgi:hypothetical protein